MINISELINDPDFCQPKGINITRTFTTIINHRPVKEEEEITVQGIITISDENTDNMEENADRNTEAINIFTYERLKTVGIDKKDGEQYSSDIVHFNGNDYVVKRCLDDEQYGFCRSWATKIEQDVM